MDNYSYSNEEQVPEKVKLFICKPGQKQRLTWDEAVSRPGTVWGFLIGICCLGILVGIANNALMWLIGLAIPFLISTVMYRLYMRRTYVLVGEEGVEKQGILRFRTIRYADIYRWSLTNPRTRDYISDHGTETAFYPGKLRLWAVSSEDKKTKMRLGTDITDCGWIFVYLAYRTEHGYPPRHLIGPETIKYTRSAEVYWFLLGCARGEF